MKLFLAGLLVLSSLSAFAKDCSNETSTYDMKICASENLKEQDLRLNDLYAKVMKKLDKEGIAKLKASQRAWITFRDADCELSGDEMRGGTMEGLIVVSCLGDMTEKRADQLQDILEFR